jgi:hypothetical protein
VVLNDFPSYGSFCHFWQPPIENFLFDDTKEGRDFQFKRLEGNNEKPLKESFLLKTL